MSNRNHYRFGLEPAFLLGLEFLPVKPHETWILADLRHNGEISGFAVISPTFLMNLCKIRGFHVNKRLKNLVRMVSAHPKTPHQYTICCLPCSCWQTHFFGEISSIFGEIPMFALFIKFYHLSPPFIVKSSQVSSIKHGREIAKEKFLADKTIKHH